MRGRERVTLYRMGERISLRPVGFDLRPHGWLAWLHRALWWALHRLGALSQKFEEKVDILRLPVSNDDVLCAIMEAREGLFQVNRRPSEVLIGPHTLAELINCPELRDWNSPFRIDATAGFERTLFNLPIRVVPQMEGVVVLDSRN